MLCICPSHRKTRVQSKINCRARRIRFQIWRNEISFVTSDKRLEVAKQLHLVRWPGALCKSFNHLAFCEFSYFLYNFIWNFSFVVPLKLFKKIEQKNRENLFAVLHLPHRFFYYCVPVYGELGYQIKGVFSVADPVCGGEASLILK